jgi:ribonuclease Z
MVFELTILGSNASSFAYGRHHTSQLLNHNYEYYLIDCGEGTQIRLNKLDVKVHRIKHIFISHLHGDHYLGLVGLISSMHLNNRTEDLHIYGPAGLDEIITLQLRLSDTQLRYPLHFVETNTEESVCVFENELLTVHTIPLDHRIRCAGFLFREKPKKRRIRMEKLKNGYTNHDLNQLKLGHDIVDEDGNVLYKNEDVTLPPRPSRSYAYCSDTRYSEAIIPLVQEVDLLYHESTFLNDRLQRATETFHSTAKQAATIALKANVQQLMLGHYSSRYKQLMPLLHEAQEVFANSILSVEGCVVKVGTLEA